MKEKRRPLVTHKFVGPRFANHGIDIDVLPDLVAFKALVVETAKELWRRSHRDRQRLPKGFIDSLRISFYGVEPESAALPLVCECEPTVKGVAGSAPNELDQAVVTVVDAILAVNAQMPLPESLPRTVIPLFSNYGKTLRENETIELILPNRETVARYNLETRRAMLERGSVSYEDDVSAVAEIRAADLDTSSFVLRLDDGTKVQARFSTKLEAIVLDGLREHFSRRVKVVGRGEFDPTTRELKRLLSIRDLSLYDQAEPILEPSEIPVWDSAAKIAATVPEAEWENEPRDVSKRIDHYLYGINEDRT